MKRFLALLGATAVCVAASGTASATSVCEDCTATYNLMVNGQTVNEGTLPVDARGSVKLDEPIAIKTDDYTIVLSQLTGNVDPFLLFALAGVNNTGAPLTFAAAFSLPLSISEPIHAQASVSYSLTDGTGDGATLFPTSGTGKVVDSQDIRLNPFLSTDKGVDVGDACTVMGFGAHNCGPYDATADFGVPGGPTYDVMSVIVAFGLTGNASAGVSGAIRQDPVPEPGTALLLIAGLAGFTAVRRRA